MRTEATGLSLGALLAVFFSYAMNHSVLYALLHLLCGWFYVGYAVLFRLAELDAAVQAVFS